MAEDEIRKHAKTAVKALRDPNRSWRHKAGEVLLEILIIIFAVTLSIWFHNWAESWKDRDDEREFLTGLREDLQADVTEMKSDLAGYEKGLRGIRYFERVGKGEPMNHDSLADYQTIFFGYIQINPRISRFEALKGRGKLDIIRNKKLLLEITDLYTKDFPSVTSINNWAYGLRQSNYLPFIASHIQFNQRGDSANWEEILRTSQMRLLIQLGEGVTNNVAFYSNAIAKCGDIIRQIDVELK